MNGSWYPWSLGGDGNTAQQYVAAWRRLHGIFQREGATNVQWVWSPNIIDASAADFTPMYPGDDYVDWVALDGYNWATRNPWKSFTELYQRSYDAITALTDRPLMIAEWGSTEQGGDKGAWLRSALTSEIPNAFPRIKAVVYFNQQYDGEDWRITTSEGARRGYADGIATPVYRESWP
jgi:beta-mannanase